MYSRVSENEAGSSSVTGDSENNESNNDRMDVQLFYEALNINIDELDNYNFITFYAVDD